MYDMIDIIITNSQIGNILQLDLPKPKFLNAPFLQKRKCGLIYVNKMNIVINIIILVLIMLFFTNDLYIIYFI